MAFNGEIYEIFSWLPPKSLYKFSSAAKPCLDYLSDLVFIEKQCRNSHSKPEDHLIVQVAHFDSHYLRRQVFVCSLTGHTSSLGKDYIPRRSLRQLSSKGRVLASSNGLVLCRKLTSYSRKLTDLLFLCNPATATWSRIKLPNKQIAKHCATNCLINVVLIVTDKSLVENKSRKFPLDYTIILFEVDTYTWTSPYIVHVFEQGKWVRKEEGLYTGIRSVDFENPVHCTDGLYLLSDTGNYIRGNSNDYSPYIVHYDFCHGTSKIRPLPQGATRNFTSRDCNMCIFGWEKSEENMYCFESLCLVNSEGSVISVWILDVGNKGKESSWSKFVEIDILRDLGIEEYKITFAVIDKNLIFNAKSNIIYKYCLEGMDRGKVRKICRIDSDGDVDISLTAYSSTLRPCVKSLDKPPLRIR